MSRRKRNRKVTKKNQTRNFYVGLGVVLIAVIAIGGYLYLDQPPEVSASRLELESYQGPEDAQVTIYEFGAYGCHACRSVHQSGLNDEILALLEEPQYKDRVNFVFVNYPVISANDPTSAEAAQCALDQGQAEFWAFHNGLYELSDQDYATMTDESDYVDLAANVGIDNEALEACLDERTHERTVEHHLDRARDRFVRGTPTFFVGSQQVNTSLASIEQAIQNQLN